MTYSFHFSIGFFVLVLPRIAALDAFAAYGVPSDTAHAALDLDLRNVLAKTGLETAAGLAEAKHVYEQGNSDGSLTLQSLGTDVDAFTDFATFAAFRNFYGENDQYAEEYLQAALNPDVSSLELGSAGASRLAKFAPTSGNIEGRVRTVSRGTLVLRVWMAVAAALEQAVHDLDEECGSGVATGSTLQAWDKAYALYTGSLAEVAEPLGGYFLYRLAQEQAEIFGTTRRGQEAQVNTKMLSGFVQGKALIEQTDCTSGQLRNVVDSMLGLLRVPVLQGALRLMYSFDEEGERRPVIQGEAAAFGIAAAGIIAQCSEGFAQTVFNDMNYGNQATGSLTVVKGAFERHYECLGITCTDMGGIITSRGDSYVRGGEACGNVRPVNGAGYGIPTPSSPSTPSSPFNPDNPTSNNDRPRAGIVTGVVVGIIVLLTLPFAVAYLLRRRRLRHSEERAAEGAIAVHVEKATGDVVLTEEEPDIEATQEIDLE